VATLVRKNIWKLSAISTWEPTILWYAKAVHVMMSRPATDPTSWRFQAGVHGYDESSDPFSSVGPIPKKSVTNKFWSQCQHGSWFFLPWHRMYLGYFEQIVRAAVVQLGGPADWALQYWNYSDAGTPQARTLPPAFRQPTLPDGTPNPLVVLGGMHILRAPAINAGNPAAIPQKDVDLTGCIGKTFFSPTTDITVGDLGFGGPATSANHDGHVFGFRSIESVPHNAIHMDVGGQTTLGWMTDPDTAALDPIFWLHHANIDRLWAVWNRTPSAHTDPAVAVNVAGRKITWATSIAFSFHDAKGKKVSMKPGDVTGTSSPFNYEYDDAGTPLAAPAHAAAAALKAMVPQRPEMIGASAETLTLTGTPQSAAISLRSPSGPGKAKAAKAAKAATPAKGHPASTQRAPEGKTYLQIENVVSRRAHTTYEVYVNLPANPDAAAYEEHYAGAMHLFGVVRASTRSARSAGNGLSFSMDISELVDRLKRKNAWDGQSVRVTFVPRAGVEGGTAGHDPIRIGSVSLYRA